MAARSSLISKVILEGKAFDILPNGLKLIPTDSITINLSTSNGQDETYESNQEVSSNKIHYAGPKIYRNYIYNVTITNPDDATLRLSPGSTLNMTLQNEIVSDFELENDKIIKSIQLGQVESTGKTRQLSLNDKDLLKDIILNSNIFVFNNIKELSLNTKSIDIVSDKVGLDAKTIARSYDIKHISEYDFEIVD